MHWFALLHYCFDSVVHSCWLLFGDVPCCVWVRAQGAAEWEVAPNLDLGDDYIMLPKSLWDIMVDWYGGGPVFCRKVVNVSSSLQLPASVGGGVNETEAASRADRYMQLLCEVPARSKCD